MTRRGAGVSALFLVVCVLIGQTAALNCSLHMLSNGSALYNLSEVAQPGCGTDWDINGIVVAHEDGFNKSVVVLQTRSSLLLHKYYPNTTYRVSCSQGLQEVTCKGPTHGGVSGASHDKSWVIMVTAIVVLLVLL